jgi:hypothetical protein
LPRMCASRFSPSKHRASRRPLPSILSTWAYSWPSSLKVSSRFSLSFSFFPRRRFLPPCALVSVVWLWGWGFVVVGRGYWVLRGMRVWWRGYCARVLDGVGSLTFPLFLGMLTSFYVGVLIVFFTEGLPRNSQMCFCGWWWCLCGG